MPNLTNRVVIAMLLSLAASFIAIGAETNIPPNPLHDLQTAIEAVLKETHTPGAAIAIVSRDKAEWMGGLGEADVAANKPVTAKTLFRIGSTSKMFAALAALQLQEQGKLRLTDPLRQWVPEVAFANPWEASDPVRLVHLMEHTTGFDDVHLREVTVNGPPSIALKDVLAGGAASRVSRWRPGTRAAYCNSGAAILAAVIEKASGERFEDYVREHIFKPLHMDSASYFLTPEVERGLAKLYHPDGITPYSYWHMRYWPSGAINASAEDMANFVRFYLQRGSLDGTQLLRPESIQRMETTESLPSAKLGKLGGYGLFNYATFEGAFVFRGHIGTAMGGVADVAYLPDYGRGYAVMLNSGSEGTLFRIESLIRQYLIRGLTPPVSPPAASVPARVRQHYAGYYQVISPRIQMLYGLERLLNIKKLTFTAKGLSTRVYSQDPEQWAPVTERLFRQGDQSLATLALLPDADGETLIETARVFGDWGTFKQVSALRVWGQVVAMCLILLLMLSSVIFALIWGTRKLLGRLPHAGPVSLRILPLVSTVLFFALAFLFKSTLNDLDLSTFGLVSPRTVTIMLLSIAFPVAAAASVWVAYRARAVPMNRVAYWHSVLVASAVAAVAAYMGYWGLIGLCLWA